MASFAQEHHHQQPSPTSYGATNAPPPTPTPSAQPTRVSAPNAADALSRLLHRLPPTLSLPPRLFPPTTSPPLISLSPENHHNLPNDLLSSSSKLGFFQLTNHHIPSQLALSAELELLSLFDLPNDKKQHLFPKNWPLGFDEDEEDEEEDEGDGNNNGVSLCLSTHCPTESAELKLSSLTEFTRALEKVGLEIVETLSKAIGFENPLGSSSPWSSLVWVSEGVAGNKPVFNGRFYPYIVALQYQIRCRKYSLLSDSGWVSVSPEIDSVLVTVGDIAQVWSNGKLKKVRGTAVASLGDEDKSRSISISLLLTLPIESTLSPLLPSAMTADGDDNKDINSISAGADDAGREKEVQSGVGDKKGEKRAAFQSFSMEDYAWRAYHERLLFKDPLDRYRI
ncbi:gibberellin 2-beta-dioxygenase 1-like [Macadamia integrifolia]|uniref:gibberellin 2-beta-dioxygenase 1-like n=1 Tax=Macadamia integrifolia TaxID=60698 RepID=UPI001C4E33A8|nr:gibberellin 2-beta-dioxygenase 1-like [Macadamia integrifolia]